MPSMILENIFYHFFLNYQSSRSITPDLYDKKFKEYEKRKKELIFEMERHDKASETYYINAAKVLELAGRTYEIFESSKVEEKRQLLNYLLQNCNLNGRKLEFTLRKPFDVILSHAKTKEWLPSPKDNITEPNVSKILDLLKDFSYLQNVKEALVILAPRAGLEPAT